MATITASVGYNGRNISSDVSVVQNLLNQKATNLQGFQKLRVDGISGPKTVNAIKIFQNQAAGFPVPDGRVDVNGQTWKKLTSGPNVPAAPAPPAVKPGGYTYFYHADSSKVTLTYGTNAVRLVPNAELLLKSILASVNIMSAELTSTLRTYHDQARITMTQTYPRNPSTVATWYGQDVLDACKRFAPNRDIQGFADWWEARDRQRGRVSSLHLSNQAMDVVPARSRETFAKAVADLVPVSGSGVRRIIPKGQLNEPVDHVEFTFSVCAK